MAVSISQNSSSTTTAASTASASIVGSHESTGAHTNRTDRHTSLRKRRRRLITHHEDDDSLLRRDSSPPLHFALTVPTTKAAADNLNISISVKFTLQNVGTLAGAEVAQLYVAYPSFAQEPPQLLKAFKKVWLQPGEKMVVEFLLRAKDLSIWEEKTHQWVIPTSVDAGGGSSPSEYQLFVGASSRDHRLSGSLEIFTLRSDQQADSENRFRR